MPILENNIKFVASQVMDDVPEGGGASTGNVIVDGQMNNIYEDVSDLDRALGRFSMRKIYLAIKTLSTDLFGGAKTVITALPSDDAISYTLFSTNDPFDTRDSAVNRVEAYMYKGPMWGGYLLENHIAGMSAINVIQRVNSPIPPVGKTLCLVANEGLASEVEQYVRVTRVSYIERDFVDGVLSGGEDQIFTRWVVTLELFDKLRADFLGHAHARRDQDYIFTTGKARIRDTVVANAMRFYGSQYSTSGADIGDTTLMARSIYTQLVPASRTETALTDQSYASQFQHVLATAPRNVTVAAAPLSIRYKIGPENRGFNYTAILKPLPAPGSVQVVYRAQGNAYTISDAGDGSLSGSGGGSVSYTTGSVLVTLEALPDAGSAVVIYYGPNRAYTNRSGSLDYRAPSVQFTLDHQHIERESVTISWTSGGTIRTATDDGDGGFTGDASGAIAYATGIIAIEPTAYPDAGSEYVIDYEYSNKIEEAFPGLTPDVAGFVEFELADVPVPGSLEITWAVSVATSVSSGVNSSAASVIKRANFSSFHTGTVAERTSFATSENGSSASYTATQTSASSVTLVRTVTDSNDGTGVIYEPYGNVLYVAKEVSLKVEEDWTETTYETAYEDAADFDATSGVNASNAGSSSSLVIKGGESGSASVKTQYAASSLVVRYKTGAGSPITHSMTVTPPPVLLDLTPNTADITVPGSLRFTWMGTTYEDFEGVVYRGRTEFDSGVASGSADYSTGLVSMTDYVPGSSPGTIAVSSLWTRNGPQEPVASIAFNTAIAPVRPAGLVVSVVDLTGTQIVGTADGDGIFDESHFYGRVDYESGLVELQFGDYVVEATLTDEERAEWWYDAADITDDDTIWRPWPVLADTLRYNVVGYTYLPLPADIIGIDAVRLPQDGRVPIYQPGDVAIVMHTDTTAPATVANSDTINCGRSRLGWVRVIGADGESYPTGYTLDRATGIVTFTDVSGMAQPVSVRHTVADLRVIKDAQINGALEFTRPLSHAFPADETVVGSCLLHGDRRARVSAVWDQTTWTGVWADNIIGSEATATLDLIAYPIEVTNEGAVSERWFLRWTSTVNVELIGQTRGLVFSGPFTADIAPVNPATRNPDGTGGVPYLRIPVAANGGGWSTGNVVRINTVGAEAPIWMARAIQQSDEPAGDGEDGCEIYCLGNVDRP